MIDNETTHADWWNSLTNGLTIGLLLLTLVVSFWAWRLIRKWKLAKIGPYGYRMNCKDDGLFILFFTFLLIATLQNLYDLFFEGEGDLPAIVGYVNEDLLPAVFMVVFMVKMSFSRWSQLDVEDERRDVTFMDREVGSQWIDYFRLDSKFKFRNFTQNIPRADSYHGSDNTSALAGNTGEATPILDVS